MTWALTGDKEEAMRFSNWKSMLRQARQPSREMPEAMQVLSSSPMTEAQGHNPDAEVFDHLYHRLSFRSMLNGYDPPDIPEAEIRRKWEVLKLVGNNDDERFPTTKRATDFWNWCGLRPERWDIVPDQALWEEFTREFELHGGYPDARTQAFPDLATWETVLGKKLLRPNLLNGISSKDNLDLTGMQLA
ncbi:uncharacterized protein N7443_009405 [Penicillium atrosanguineum]|uniref:uncharacterized protein n=1 Tax=Penicillium atrosanguineum TaxID=1132637 RepID=UPI0023A4186F|nr:uncharacterized protein N7443_009405 [Penicillium atrosanguineum]KAJ5293452.1 hypothetical protein N7443_009405 [Penicillium atrosanguineum]